DKKFSFDIDDFDVITTIFPRQALTGFDGEKGWLFYSIGKQGPYKAKTIAGGTISGLRWHPDGRRLAFNVSSADAPGSVRVLAAKTEEAAVWVHGKSDVLPGKNLNRT